MHLLSVVLMVLLGLVAVVPAAHAQLAISVNDNKVVLDNGSVKVVPNPAPDTVTIIDLAASPPRVVAETRAPASVVGPPLSVALTPDESLALVTAAQKIDPADPTKQVPDNKVSVIDLKANPPAVIATLEAGASPAGLSINRQGTLALVANRAEGTVSVFTIRGKTVTPAGKVTIADAKSGVSHVTIAPDGKLALVSRDGDDRISVLSIDGTKVEHTKRDLNAGLRPYGIDIASNGAFAAVANIGRGQGDADTVSLIDLKATPPRVVETLTVGQTPEGIKVSPDSQHVAVVVMNGSNKAKSSPFYNDNGKLVMLRVSGTSLAKVAEAPIGHWSQGAAFSPDGKTVLVGNMVEKDVQVFAWDGRALRETARIKVNGGSAALRTAEK
ncbi:MAG: YncE family protein [Candidatus Rokubacteria bacterium]|nr:YncE family protein [Candidatus Rokubacteria bacterium]